MNIDKVLEKLTKEDELDNGLVTELRLYADGSWDAERESDGKVIAGGETIESLIEWSES